MPKRVHCRSFGFGNTEAYAYVGRPSRLGNPFRIGQRTGDGRKLNRDEAVMLFAWWVYEHPSLMRCILDQRGKDVGCHCGPRQRCHGDVILGLANS